MTPNSRLALVAGMPIAIGVLTFQLAHAQIQEKPGPICRLVWDDRGTGAGDTRSTHAELTMSSALAPNIPGTYTADGTGEGTVTYYSANRCPVTRGSPWTAHFEANLTSDDGRSATVQISSPDDSHSVTVACGRGAATFDVDASFLPKTTVPLKDGVASEYSWSKAGGRVGARGTITLFYCKK